MAPSRQVPHRGARSMPMRKPQDRACRGRAGHRRLQDPKDSAVRVSYHTNIRFCHPFCSSTLPVTHDGTWRSSLFPVSLLLRCDVAMGHFVSRSLGTSLCCVLGRSDTTVTLEWNPCTAQGTVAYELQVINANRPLASLAVQHVHEPMSTCVEERGVLTPKLVKAAANSQ